MSEKAKSNEQYLESSETSPKQIASEIQATTNETLHPVEVAEHGSNTMPKQVGSSDQADPTVTRNSGQMDEPHGATQQRIKNETTDDQTTPKQVLDTQNENPPPYEENVVANSSRAPNMVTHITAQTAHVYSDQVQHTNGQQTVNDLETLKNKLKAELRKVANEKSGMHHAALITEENCFEKVREQDHNQNTFDVERQLYSKEKLASTYSTPQESNIFADGLFAAAQENAEQEARYATDASKESHIQKHGRIVGVLGEAGIGKTTFIKKYVQNVLKNRLSFQVSFLFLIFVRELNFSKSCTLLQFLLHSILPDWHHTKESDDALIKLINDDPNVMIVIDGFDEALNLSIEMKYQKVSLLGSSTPWDLLCNLMDGNLLKLAKKLISSRPNLGFLKKLPHTPHFLVKMKGLSQASQDDIAKEICKEKYNELELIFAENPELSLYWYVPIYCIMALAHFCKLKKGQSVSIPFTAILSSTFLDFATEHLRNKETELDSLTAFAYENLRYSQCIFKRNDVTNAGLSGNTIDALLCTSLTTNSNIRLTILEGKKNIYFSHLIWQEFFAAVHTMASMSLARFNIQLNAVRNYSDLYFKFLCGSCNRNVFQQLQGFVFTSTSLWSEKKNVIKSFLLKRIEQALGNPKELFHYCSLLKETNDESMLSDVVSKLQNNRPFKIDVDLSFFGGLITPSNIAGLCYLLKGFSLQENSQNNIHLDVHSYMQHAFHDDSFQRLTQHIASGIKVEILDLSGCRVGQRGAEFLSNILCNVRKLMVNRCGISHGLNHIGDKLQELQTPMEVLNLGGNKIFDVGLIHLVAGLRNVNTLCLEDCGITSNGMEVLAQGLRTLSQPIEGMILSGNPINDEGISTLENCMGKIRKLEVMMCNITGRGIESLSAGLLQIDTKMKCLVLSENSIGLAGVDALKKCGHKVEKIHLHYCSIRERAKAALKEKHEGVFEFEDTSQKYR